MKLFFFQVTYKSPQKKKMKVGSGNIYEESIICCTEKKQVIKVTKSVRSAY